MMNKQYKKIAVFRALQLGDLLCSVPALRSLRFAYPDAHITLISLPWAYAFTQRFPQYINDFIPFPGFPGLPEQSFNTKKILDFIKIVRMENFDLLLQMHGNGSIINPILQLLGGKKVAGFYQNHDYCPNPQLFLEYPKDVSEIERQLALLQFLQIPTQTTNLEFPITTTEKNNLLLHPLFQELRDKDYICMHVGARDPQRQWEPRYFSLLADALSAKNYQIILTGVEEEVPLIQEIVKNMKTTPIIFAGKLSLGETAELLNHAKLLISNCTSIVHIADALNIASVTIYLTSNPVRWGPQNQALHKRIIGNDCMEPKKVLQESLALLKQQLTMSFESGGVYEKR